MSIRLKCERARDLWHDGLDGRLQAEDAAALADHLEQCAACRAYDTQMRALTGALDELRRETESVGSAPSPRRTIRHWWPAAGRIAAAIAIMVGATAYFLRPDGVVAPPPAPPARIAAAVTLEAESAQRYLIVQKETSAANVHFFQLYRVYTEPPDPASDS